MARWREAAFHHAALVLGLAVIFPFASFAPAQAADHPQTLPGWQPAPFEDFTLPAGTFCPFALHVDILRNDAIVATTKSFPDGTPQRQVYMGPQRLRLRNANTGKSVLTYLDGILVYDYAGDGSLTVTALGKNIVGFLQGDSFPTGYYFIDGYHVIHYTPNGNPGQYSRQMVSAIGVENSYCRTLSGPPHDHD